VSPSELPAPPLPPLELRQLVGPVDPAAFDNPSGAPVFPQVPLAAYESVLDFGCGCGRLARQLLQSSARPERYVGIDLHRGMIRWCRRHLAPLAPGFSFRHHDVFNRYFNPGRWKRRTASLPARDASITLVVAWSVFTHLTEEQAPFYLREVARVLRPDGYFLSTWFLFDKQLFPMLHEFQNALYVNHVDPTNAVVFDREWLRRTARDAGLVIAHAEAPAVRGFQWLLVLRPTAAGATEVELPPDDAPIGALPPPLLATRADRIGL